MENLINKLKQNGIKLFTNEHYLPKYKAQNNLEGLTHYYDDGTMKYFSCRILKCSILYEGLILGTLESVLHPTEGRIKRVVFFDVFGHVINNETRGNYFKSTKAVEKFFWQVANNLDAIQITLDALHSKIAQLENETNRLKACVLAD